MLIYKSGLENAVNSANIKQVAPFTFAKNTTYGLGGNALKAYYPRTPWQAKQVYDNLKSCGTRFEIVGCGSNLLVSDSGMEGEVISTRDLRGIIRLSADKLLCLAGTRISELLAYCKNHSLGGLEYLYGIPATVGGAAYMNAGVSGFAIGDNIVDVCVYDGKIAHFSHEMCKFGYRRSTMRDINALILSIIVKVDECSLQDIDDRISYFKNRRSHLPKGKSCGCVFKNPEGYCAGKLIDFAGLKGYKVGGARVSDIHADFILNEGATANDVKTLINLVKSRVFEKFGIVLEEEVVYIGEFNDFNS
ncbi:MAG: UDP-N-acetylmuramate dehydrogenase [Clostridia bacterium]|nr:UDP-N-acetylmuramate dehydrogenase [Clostridia bacterium]